ncbi:tryptophan 7-halogenase [Paraliomyxa miuraensis]|uniref:tryptophan 7-halogenase n=1 Tax=Paraliomyxa miuraensis TaxID=376150 RepID=UPI00224F8EC2|nr:tryptophan 7-halogenase [Paraliomyxa miuraensis]MCX4247005.1 tryptophan 7-halogenase [Paraliomyxa miuraensis]
MRIVVIGGGTAGTMAAAHITWALPKAELLHVSSSRVPIIGVGESTTPAVPRWLDQIGGPSFAELRARCHATTKRAGCFEGWGRDRARFLHWFQPTGEHAYHFDARLLVEVLGERIRAERLDAFVTAVRSDGTHATVELEDGTRLGCDYVLDARGFPRRDDPDVQPLRCIPTNAALVQFSTPLAPPAECPDVTRNVARPHGWVFLIPLGDRTSVGYVHDETISSRAEVEADFEALLHEEGGEPLGERRLLRFPNFVRRTTFDGALMRVGNTASFTEPLEALSIGTIIFQLRSFTQWVRDRPSGARRLRPRPRPRPLAGADAAADAAAARLASFNQGLASYVRRNAVFLAWHYAAGSRHDSRFWTQARGCFPRAAHDRALAADVERFLELARSSQGLRVDDLDRIADREQWVREVFPRLRNYRPFGNFSELNVAQVGQGIGWLPVEEEHHAGHR